MNGPSRNFLIAWWVWAALGVAFWAVVIYVAAHFIAKWW